MKLLLSLSLASLAACTLAARAADIAPTPAPLAKAAPPGPPATAGEVAVIQTTAGAMVAELWPQVAPGTVANFIKLAREGYFNGTAFHRIIPGFMIQGGDPLTKDPAKEALWGTGGPGYQIKAEFNDRRHVRGVLSMARSADPDSAGSQFFLMLGDAPSLDGKYTAFGRLIEGDDVLAKIAATPIVDNGRGEVSKPTARVEIKTLTIKPR